MAYRSLLLAMALVMPGIATSQGPPPQTFESDGVRIRYVDRGQGPVVLLVHGFAVNVELNWGINGILDSLAKSYRVVALDLRGHGQSSKPREPSAYGANYVQDIVNLLDHLRIERAQVVGYSLGAVITTKLLVSHPDRVASAVLGGGGFIRPGEERPALLRGWLAALERAARDGSPVYDALRMPNQPDFPPPIVALVNQNDAAALVASLRGDSSLMVTEAELRGVKLPVMAVAGANDELALPSVNAMSALVPGMGVRILPGLDHLSAVNHPLFMQAVRDFLRTSPTPPSPK